jgi:serine/threonine protein kinase
MAYYEGETLKEKIARGSIDAREAVRIASQVGRGLAKAHSRGIVHRDIKPANIMVTDEGEAKILDFGLAKLAGQIRLTKVSSTLGTVAYMSPE